MFLTEKFDLLARIYCSSALLASLANSPATRITLNKKFETILCWKFTTTPRIIFPQLLLLIMKLTHTISICVYLMAKIRIFILLQNASWNGTFYLDTKIYMTHGLFFDQLFLEHINFSHPVVFTLNNVLNVKLSVCKSKAQISQQKEKIYWCRSWRIPLWKSYPSWFWCFWGSFWFRTNRVDLYFPL